MSRKPLVSVIIIFLNTELFIQEAIESVLAQTYTNWELLLVDDGSTDRSTEITRWYAERYPEQVRYFEHQSHRNCGKAVSRNLGIRHATGAYLAFLDADDVWMPQKLEHQVEILESQPDAAMVYGPTEWWYSWTGRLEDSQRDGAYELGVPADTLFEPPTLFTRFFLRQTASIPCTCSILVRRETLEQVAGFEEAFHGMCDVYEDQAFYAKVCLKAPVFVSGDCWDRYRQHPDSSCSVVAKSRQEDIARLFFLNWLARYLSEQGIKDPKLVQPLQRQLWQYRYLILRRCIQGAKVAARKMQALLMGIARRTLPSPIRHWLWAKWTGTDYCPPAGWIRFGSLRRVNPISQDWGFERGLPVDRYYIEQFLAAHSLAVGGRVLEIADNVYTRQFGGARVTHSDILHIVEGDPKATIVGDLACADHIPSSTFDCVILTQTLQLIYDVRGALKTVYRILKPGGVVLATVPGISQLSRYDMDRWGHFWSFTSLSARRLFEEVFPPTDVQVATYGNVLTATALLHGIVTQELRQSELDHQHPDYEVIIGVRAVKPL